MTPFFAQLEEELDRSAARLHRRRRQRARVLEIAAAAVAVLVAAGIAVMVSRGDEEAVADVRIEQSGDFVTVAMRTGQEDADDVASQLEDAGLQVRREASPTGPSQVGTVVGFFGGTAQPIQDAEGRLRITVARGSILTLLVGEPTEGSYMLATNALAASEPLHCKVWIGQDATSAVAALPAGLDVRFRTEVDESVDPDDLAGYVVQDAIASSPRDVSITVVLGEAIHEPPCQ